jgi:hypothetical protein
LTVLRSPGFLDVGRINEVTEISIRSEFRLGSVFFLDDWLVAVIVMLECLSMLNHAGLFFHSYPAILFSFRQALSVKLPLSLRLSTRKKYLLQHSDN